SGRQETLRIEPWGPDAVRVRARLGGPVLEGLPGALLDEAPATESSLKIGDGEGQLTVGALTVEVSAEGLIRFLRTDDGREGLAGNGTRWVADSARQIDYWITAGTPADGQRRYSAVTGRTPMLPEWAAGFWQCKLRYRTQDELLAVAREYKRRGLPISA